MEFTTGLMSLDTALNEMLSRVTPLTAQETLPLVQCFGLLFQHQRVAAHQAGKRGDGKNGDCDNHVSNAASQHRNNSDRQ